MLLWLHWKSNSKTTMILDCVFWEAVQKERESRDVGTIAVSRKTQVGLNGHELTQGRDTSTQADSLSAWEKEPCLALGFLNPVHKQTTHTHTHTHSWNSGLRMGLVQYISNTVLLDLWQLCLDSPLVNKVHKQSERSNFTNMTWAKEVTSNTSQYLTSNFAVMPYFWGYNSRDGHTSPLISSKEQ